MTPAPGDDADMRVGMARMEAKLDVAIAHQGAAIEGQGRRLDRVEADAVKARDEMDTLRDTVTALAARPVLTGKSVLAAVAMVVTILGGFVVLLDRLYA